MPNVFVFGSNLAGRHGKGAALSALKDHGATYGQGCGLQGSSYAIPTKDHQLKPLKLFIIKSHILTFLVFAAEHRDLTFQLTRVGCGLAGYKDFQIAPMFKGAPNNVIIPEEWMQYVRDNG